MKETQAQVARLEKAGQLLGIKITGKKCIGMEGCIQEGAEALEEEGSDNVLDRGIIGAGSRVEHYEIAGYLTALSLAKRIGATEVVSLLEQSLAEEQAAEKKLRQIASGLIKSAANRSFAGGIASASTNYGRRRGHQAAFGLPIRRPLSNPAKRVARVVIPAISIWR